MSFWTDYRVLSALALLGIALGFLIYWLMNRDNPYSKIGGKPSSKVKVILYSSDNLVLRVDEGLYGQDGLYYRGKIIPVTSEMIEIGNTLVVSLKKKGSGYIPLKVTHLSVNNEDEAKIIADILPDDKILMFNAGFERTYYEKLKGLVDRYKDPVQNIVGTATIIIIPTIFILAAIVLLGNWILDAKTICVSAENAKNASEIAGVLGGMIK